MRIFFSNDTSWPLYANPRTFSVREPLPICPAEVERAYENREEPLGCINPEFFELPDRDGFRVIEKPREG